MMVAIVALIAGLALLVWSAWIFYLVPRIIESSSEYSKTLLFVENVEVVPSTDNKSYSSCHKVIILRSKRKLNLVR